MLLRAALAEDHGAGNLGPCPARLRFTGEAPQPGHRMGGLGGRPPTPQSGRQARGQAGREPALRLQGLLGLGPTQPLAPLLPLAIPCAHSAFIAQMMNALIVRAFCNQIREAHDRRAMWKVKMASVRRPSRVSPYMLVACSDRPRPLLVFGSLQVSSPRWIRIPSW